MTWCPDCREEKPTKQLAYEGPCPICESGYVDHTIPLNVWPHGEPCRGTAAGYLTACDSCNAPVFASARTSEEYNLLEQKERLMTQYLATQTNRNWAGRIIPLVVLGLIVICIAYFFVTNQFK